jgi:WD40 repeat protein
MGLTAEPSKDGDKPRLKVFVSYSRRDLTIVDGLARRLQSRTIEALIDRSHIEKFEDWWERIAALIRAADTVMFVLSPNAVASEVCQREVDYAASLNKRFAPVVIEDVPPHAVPKALAKLNYVYLRASDDAEQAFEELVAGLIKDTEWVREHTRIGELAHRWCIARERTPEGAEALLLRGLELAEAELWISRRPREAPEPTEVHRSFIQDSRKAEQARARREAEQLAARERAQRRARVALTGIFVLTVLTAAWAAWQARETAKREARIVTSLAQKAAREGHYDRAMRIAVQGLPPIGALPFSFHSEEVEAVLSGAAMLSLLKAQLAHGAPVRAAEFSPDGRRLVTASEDNDAHEGHNAYVWDAFSGKQILVLKGHGHPIRRASFSPDGSRIMTASEDRTARLWDAESGRQIAVMEHGGAVGGAVFSRDGTMAVTASYDGNARVWDGATGKLRNTLFGHRDWIWTAVFSPDGKRIVTTSKDGTARLWHANSGSAIAVLDGHNGVVHGAAFSSDGRRIVTASFDKTIRLWSAETGVEIAILSGHEDEVWEAAFNPLGPQIVTASKDKTARIWNMESDRQTILNGHEGALRSIAVSPDGRKVLTASTDSTARIWEMETGKEMAVLKGHGGYVYSAVFSPDGKQIATASQDGYARIWEAELGTVSAVPTARVDGNAVISPCDDMTDPNRHWPSGDKQRTVIVPRDGPPMLLNAEDGPVSELKGLDGKLCDVAFGPDDRHFVTASTDNTARLWNAADGKLLVVLNGHRKHIWSARFSADGRLVATASEDGTARLWHAASGIEIAILSDHGRAIRSVAFRLDGLETRSDDGTARLWDLNWVTQTGPELRDRVCREKLVGAQVMTNADAEDPILSALKQTNVCERRGPVSLRYWMQAANALRTSAMRPAVYLWQQIFARGTPGE